MKFLLSFLLINKNNTQNVTTNVIKELLKKYFGFRFFSLKQKTFIRLCLLRFLSKNLHSRQNCKVDCCKRKNV